MPGAPVNGEWNALETWARRSRRARLAIEVAHVVDFFVAVR
jgi:hypothetical protein